MKSCFYDFRCPYEAKIVFLKYNFHVVKTVFCKHDFSLTLNHVSKTQHLECGKFKIVILF